MKHDSGWGPASKVGDAPMKQCSERFVGQLPRGYHGPIQPLRTEGLLASPERSVMAHGRELPSITQQGYPREDLVCCSTQVHCPQLTDQVAIRRRPSIRALESGSCTCALVNQVLNVSVAVRISMWVLILLLAGGSFAWADGVGEPGGGAPRLPRATAEGSPGPVGRGQLVLPEALTLPAYDSETLRRMQAKHGPSWLGPTLELPSELDGTWGWTQKGERVWRASIRAAGARALRVRFEDFNAQGSVWLYGDEWVGSPVGPYRQAGPHRDGRFWSEFVLSDSVTIEYVADTAAKALESVPFRIHSVAPIVTEQFPVAGRQVKPRELQPRALAGCHLDVSCYPRLQARDRPSVARLYITNTDGTATCTGFLINPSHQSDDYLLLLTAAHCIDTQEEAEDVAFVWNYQTESCYGNPDWEQWAEPLAYTYGADLVVSKHDRYDDFALLALRRSDIQQVTGWWAEGWSTAAPRTGDLVSTVGHPDGNHKRAAFGQVVRESWENLSSLGFGTIQWRLGTAEPGSSGSPVFTGTGDDRRVVGILSASNGSRLNQGSAWGPYCDPDLRTTFNLFDRIYETIEPYLTSEQRLLAKLEAPGAQETPDDHGNRALWATLVSVGSATPGRIEQAGDVDYFRFWVSQQTDVRIFTTGTTDTVGSVSDSSGRVVEDDDSGASLNFLIGATLEPGTSYVRVGAYDNKTGAYILHVEAVGRVQSPGAYRPLAGLLVSPGSIQLRLPGVSLNNVGACSSWRASSYGNSYEFRTSKWQWRTGPGRTWTDIRGTSRIGVVCPYWPGQAGEYRLVGEIIINGDRIMYSSENILRWP